MNLSSRQKNKHFRAAKSINSLMDKRQVRNMFKGMVSDLNKLVADQKNLSK